MNDFEKTKKSLETILKKGDLYDVIAKRENKIIPRHTSFFKFHILLFSRILYGGVLLGEKIKSFFAPVFEVKKAQEQIRKVLGVSVDIICSKKEIFFDEVTSIFSFAKNILAVFYENEGISIEAYLKNLKKIHHFCELYNIKNILLKESDITSIFPNLEEEEFLSSLKRSSINLILNKVKTQFSDSYLKSFQEKLGFDYDINEKLNEQVFLFTQDNLYLLIKKIERAAFDKETLLGYREKIEDRIIKNAITKFFRDADIGALKRLVNSRLELIINSDNSYKDKQYGKICETVKIREEYIQVFVRNSEGKVLSNRVMTLFDYFDVPNYNGFLKKINTERESEDVLFICALYLYLCQKSKINISSTNNNRFISLYDYFYKVFCAKQKGIVKKIPGLYSVKDKVMYEAKSFSNTFYYTMILFCLTIIVESLKINVTENLKDEIIDFYEMSWKFEKNIISPIKNGLDEFFEFYDNENSQGREKDFFSSKSIIGDVENAYDEEEVATVIPLQENAPLPSYYAESYAVLAHYGDGSMQYEMSYPFFYIIPYDIEPIFEIQHAISKEYLSDSLWFDSIELHKTLYPVGDNYALVSITITDLADLSKVFVWDSNRESVFLNDDEVMLLKSMEEPQVSYIYGMNKAIENVFVEHMYKYGSYTEYNVETAITKGLGLKEDASLEEIFAAIQNKTYSTTPLKDARLSNKLEKISEIEYFETIASLDSLVCNLAATLAVGADDDLIYVSGYLNVDDEYISIDEAHAWAMNQDGEIVDVTPSVLSNKEKVRQSMQSIFSWSIEHYVPFYEVLLLISVMLEKKFGKKVVFQFKIMKVKKLLDKPNRDKSYAKLMETLYGGINIPIKRSPSEFVKTITKDFGGYTEEELKDLKKELEKKKLNSSRELSTSLKLVDEIPFMQENQDILRRILKREEK